MLDRRSSRHRPPCSFGPLGLFRPVRDFSVMLFVPHWMRFHLQEGVDPPRKPLPRKKIPSDLRSLARGHTELCIKVLAGIVSQEASPAAARVSAAGILLERGWGRAAQVHSDADGGPIRSHHPPNRRHHW